MLREGEDTELRIGELLVDGRVVGCYVKAHVCTSWFCREAWRRLGQQVEPGRVVKTYWGGLKVTYYENVPVADISDRSQVLEGEELAGKG